MLATVALYLTYCFAVCSVVAGAYCWLDKRSRGVLVPPAELRLLREYRSNREQFKTFKSLPEHDPRKSWGRAVGDLLTTYKTERDAARAEVHWLKSESAAASRELIEAEQRLTDVVYELDSTRKSADVAWGIAESRYDALMKACSERRTLTEKLEERDEEIDELKREVAQLRPSNAVEGFGHGVTWTFS